MPFVVQKAFQTHSRHKLGKKSEKVSTVPSVFLNFGQFWVPLGGSRIMKIVKKQVPEIHVFSDPFQNLVLSDLGAKVEPKSNKNLSKFKC